MHNVQLQAYSYTFLCCTFPFFLYHNFRPANVITEKGAWCWFADLQSVIIMTKSVWKLSIKPLLIILMHAIKAHKLITIKTQEESIIRSYFQPDDQTIRLLILPDARHGISRHTDETCFYYRISQTWRSEL